MKDIKISIIIPCYQVEKYIDECLTSVFNQSIPLDWLEVIAIDDGSTDGTLIKLKKWQRQYANQLIVISYQTNRGPSYARNRGIERAQGEYINLLDADDWQTPDAYEKMLEVLEHTSYDVVIGKHRRIANKYEIPKENDIRKDEAYSFVSRDNLYWHKYDRIGNRGEFFTLGASLIRRKIIEENRIVFPEAFYINEDDYWFTIVQLYAHDVYILDDVIHYYRITPNSLMTTNNERLLQRLKLYEALAKELKRRGAWNAYYEEILGYFVNRYLFSSIYVFFVRMNQIPNVLGDMLDNFVALFPDWDDLYDGSHLSADYKLILEFVRTHAKHTNSITEEVVREFQRAYLGMLT